METLQFYFDGQFYGPEKEPHNYLFPFEETKQ